MNLTLGLCTNTHTQKIDFRTSLENASVTLHVENLHYLEICNLKNDISPDIIKGIFTIQENNSY